MSLLTYIQIDMIPLLTLALILCYSRVGFQSFHNTRRLKILICMVISIMILDTGNWYYLSDPFRYAPTVLWIIDTLYFLLTEVISYYWFLYVYHQTHDNNLTPRQQRGIRLSIFPLIFICCFILTTPWTHWIFSVDLQTHEYIRGPYHMVHVIFGFGYMLTASIFALAESRRANLPELQKEYRFLGLVVLLPFLGGTLQIINYDLVFLWPMTAAAIFLMYVDSQKHQISLDALTLLNNRGTLERYLQQKLHSQKTGWFLLMIDVDRFKGINDQYGHIQGDMALQLIANAMRNTYGPKDSFLARYVGDEFLIILDYHTADQVEESIQHCRQHIQELIQAQGLPFNLEISVGYAQYTPPDIQTLSHLLKQADQNMYLQKQTHKEGTKK